jgi:CDP-diacylglycerol--glycerol-3-phosphate 3-phosphatidyltransferase
MAIFQKHTVYSEEKNNLMNKEEKIFNLPNALSAYRIIALPFILYSIICENKNLFITLISINLISDILDGLIARLFKLETEFGARLDSLADIGTYLMSVIGIFQLEKVFVKEQSLYFYLLIALYLAGQIICLFRFKRAPSLHLYSSKITGYLQGIFIFTYFVFGYNSVYFYFMCCFSYLSYLEEIIIVSLIPSLRSNVRSLYFMLKEHNQII